MSEAPKQQFQFATEADFSAWLQDLGTFGTAIVDENGKHVPFDEEMERIKKPLSEPVQAALDEILNATKP